MKVFFSCLQLLHVCVHAWEIKQEGKLAHRNDKHPFESRSYTRRATSLTTVKALSALLVWSTPQHLLVANRNTVSQFRHNQTNVFPTRRLPKPRVRAEIKRGCFFCHVGRFILEILLIDDRKKLRASLERSPIQPGLVDHKYPWCVCVNICIACRGYRQLLVRFQSPSSDNVATDQTYG